MLFGSIVGFLNGLFGAGGGMIAVPLLKKMGVDGKYAHATSLALILPLSIISGFLYLNGNNFSISDTFIFLPAGVVGALVGAFLLPRIKTTVLRRIFALVVLFSAFRIFFK